MLNTSLTKNERRILDVVNSAPEKVVRTDVVRRSVGLTPRGLNTVLDRIVRRGLVAYVAGGLVTITFGGMRAVRSVEA